MINLLFFDKLIYLCSGSFNQIIVVSYETFIYQSA